MAIVDITYYVNGLDFTDLVYSKPTLVKKVGRGSSLATNNIQINAINENYLFSLESEESFLYEYRSDYSQIEVTIQEGDVVKWKGVIDNISRNEDGTVLLTCVESIIKVLSVKDFIYYSGDGFVGDMSYAGDDVTPAEHQLAILRRFLDDENIDIGSFKDLTDYWTANTVYISCEVIRETPKTPLSYIQDLLLNSGYLIIENDKIRVKLYRPFLGDYGFLLNDNVIVEIQSIDKEKFQNPFYSYSITYDNSGVPEIIEGSTGDSGTSTDTTSTTLTDDTQNWDIDEWKDKFVFIGDPGEKDVLKITGNNKTQLFYEDCTKSGVQQYVITKNSEVFQSDYSDYPIKISSGASIVGTLVINKSTQEKLQISFSLLDYMGLDVGDNVTLNIPTEGIINQPFQITEFKKELYSDIASVVCIDRIIYPILEEYQIVELTQPTNLTGYRIEDGSAYLTWDVISGAAYYIVWYGTSPDSPSFSYLTPNYVNVHIIDHLEKWLGYYFWVVGVNFMGIESVRSDSLLLPKVNQSSGYIDGSLGYLYEDFQDWGYLEDYFYLITYKNISYSDIGYLLKSPFVILDKSQASFSEEVSQVYADSEASQRWGNKYRRAGYLDGAGSSSYLPEFVYDLINGHKLKNSLGKNLTIEVDGVKTIIAPNDDIPNSEDWFLKDKDDNYCTYWFQTGFMWDINDENLQEWFRVFKINQAMGIFESGTANITVNENKVATLTHATKSWLTDQWEDYYVGIVSATNPFTAEWYKIKSNTSNTLTFDYGGDDVTGQKYIINNEPYTGFHGLIIDDVWTSIYSEEVNLSNSDSNTTSDSSTATVLTDSSKSWTEDEWIGYYVSIEGGTLLEITDNDDTTLTFSGNLNTGSSQSYIIYEKYYNDTGMYYWQAMAGFIAMIIEHVEDNSYAMFDSWDKAEQGLVVINTWPDKWEAYPYYVAAVNNRYRHFLMFEALQCTWNMANEVTKQFILLDWKEVVDRWDLMKISAGIGYARLAILGYPPHQQMLISHIAGSLIMSRYSDMIEDITSAGNIVLDQLFYDMSMAANYKTMLNIGIPDTGYEDSYVQSQYDRYGIIVRKFTGAYILFNPSRQIRTVQYTFDENVVDNNTGIEYTYGITYEFIFAPRTAIIFYKASDPSAAAFNFLINYEPYSYFDYNACWIVFTSAGETAIGTNSVWLVNGYTNNKRFVLDGSQSIPDGTIEHMLHAGDGADTAVIGHDPENEVLSGDIAGSSIQLTSLTVLHVVKIISGGSTWVAEDSGTDANGYAGVDWLEDATKSWTPDEWVGKYVSIEGETPLLISGNTANELYFSGNPHPEGNVNYEIGYTDIISPTVLVPNTDYLVEQKEWDITASGKGKWKTYIYLLTDQSGLDLTTYYYEQGTEDGWPRIIAAGEQVEHGICYRKNSGFSLITGDIAENDCATTLVEGTDYYVFPEGIRWKWDYRIKPFGDISEETTFDATINLNMIYAVGGNIERKAIHWGNIDPDNAVLVKAEDEKYNSINGVIADYSSSLVQRPKVLIYGFTKAPRNEDLSPIAPASREYDVWLFENQLKKFVDINYDEVVVTGDWDGIVETGSQLGAWGSIQGMIADSSTDWDTWQDIADYFDVIIINDTFLEYESGSPSSCVQWSSWLKYNDYQLLKNFKKRANKAGRDTMIIDRRSGCSAFVWYGGYVPIQNYLLNKGAALTGGSDVMSDLTDVFGFYVLGGIDVSEIYDDNANIYTKTIADTYAKYSTKLTTDFRIGKKVDITEHYIFDENKEEEHPVSNVWENGGTWISYIPKSSGGREYFNEEDILFEESNLYLLWKDITNLLPGEDYFYKYERMGLNNIILRREPLLIYHSHNYFNLLRYGGDIKHFGNNITDLLVVYPSPFLSDVGEYRGIPFFDYSGSLEIFLKNKYLFMKESNDEELKSVFSFSDPKWLGYRGNYISNITIPTFTLGGSLYHDFGWLEKDEWQQAYDKFWGWFYDERLIMNIGKVLIFDTWCDEIGDIYKISKTKNANACIPYQRTSPAPFEGNINRIVKNGDGTCTFYVDFDISDIDLGDPLATGTITDGTYDIINFEYRYFKTNIDIRPYRTGAYYCHITTDTGIVVLKILDQDRYMALGPKFSNNQFSAGKIGGDPDKYNGCSFAIRPSAAAKAYKMITLQTISDNNIICNGSLLAKNNSNRSLTVYLSRGVNQSSAGGSIIIYQGEEDFGTIDENGDTVNQVGNRELLGGRISGIDEIIGVDIATTFTAEGEVDRSKPRGILEGLSIDKKPSSMAHYEWAYGKLIKEFGYEKNTGLITSQEFFAYGATNRPPVVFWPGISENDTHEIINKKIGTKLIFNDLNIQAGDIIYLYYNSFNDMLRIKREDVENAIDGYYKFGDLKTSDQTLQEAIIKNNTEEE
jgi:hypothetical protein